MTCSCAPLFKFSSAPPDGATTDIKFQTAEFPFFRISGFGGQRPTTVNTYISGIMIDSVEIPTAILWFSTMSSSN